MKPKELKEILEKHRKWLNDEDGGSRANLCRANLCDANLCDANLRGADLRYANLCDANLRDANLRDADLCGADLRGANLRDADLRDANLRGADLCGADLRGADLSGADLCGANLRGADLRYANLCDAEILDELLASLVPICCPEYGAFVGWKKCRDNLIVKLRVEEDAKRSSAFGRKCRCSKATVLAIEKIDGTSADETEVRSQYDFSFVYRVGETVEVSDFDEDRKNECAAGIHFFITRREAVDYQ